MKCPIMSGYSCDPFSAMLALKMFIAIWVAVVPLMFLKRLDKLLKILEDKKK